MLLYHGVLERAIIQHANGHIPPLSCHEQYRLCHARNSIPAPRREAGEL